MRLTSDLEVEERRMSGSYNLIRDGIQLNRSSKYVWKATIHFHVSLSCFSGRCCGASLAFDCVADYVGVQQYPILGCLSLQRLRPVDLTCVPLVN